MTAFEATEYIKSTMRVSTLTTSQKIAFELAISALEKQIAKKPLEKTQEYDGEYGLCPNCGKVVSDYKEPKRCSDCAQALDWSDTE